MPFAMIAGSWFGNYKDGFRFDRLAMGTGRLPQTTLALHMDQVSLFPSLPRSTFAARSTIDSGSAWIVASSEKNCALFVSLKVEISAHVSISRP